VRLKDKVAVVTGGGSGIGAAMARRFAREGARTVVVADLNGAAADDVAADISGHGVQANVALEEDLLRVIDTTQSRFGPIDLVCSNAGVTAVGGPEVPDEAWQRVWSVNVMAHVYAARALVPRMLERGQGYLLQTASAAGLLSQFDAPYAVTKHAAVAFSEWLAITYGGRGLKVSCLCPGGVDTPMLRSETPARQRLLCEGMISADRVADAVIEGLDAERFLILPHPSIAELVRRKADDPDRWLRGMSRLHEKARSG
jgi:NAD(P)-dependent dehydrogenase (short-subunit alcohol dehydrogenase family)